MLYCAKWEIRVMRTRLEGIETRGDERWPKKLTPYTWSELGVVLYSNITKSNGCWLWTGKVADNGYGLIRFRRTYYYTHRLSWMLHKRGHAIYNDLHCLHKCNNRLCVKPSHLYLGTHQDNMRDRDIAADKKRMERRQAYEARLAALPPKPEPVPFIRRI